MCHVKLKIITSILLMYVHLQVAGSEKNNSVNQIYKIYDFVTLANVEDPYAKWEKEDLTEYIEFHKTASPGQAGNWYRSDVGPHEMSSEQKYLIAQNRLRLFNKHYNPTNYKRSQFCWRGAGLFAGATVTVASLNNSSDRKLECGLGILTIGCALNAINYESRTKYDVWDAFAKDRAFCDEQRIQLGAILVKNAYLEKENPIDINPKTNKFVGLFDRLAK
ncbi:MAG: hypothetical protein ACXWL2_05245 [Candidatus Chromulinivorax sp.]